jgi:hypothetical protein
LNVGVFLVDPDLQDRLNSKSPAYSGDEYARGINVLYLTSYGVKRSYPLYGNTNIQAPFHEGGASKYNGGYYYLNASPMEIMAAKTS